MEKGMDSCSWFNVLDNKTSSNTDFLSWMKRQQQQTTCSTGPKVSIMAAHHHHHHHQQTTNPDRPFFHDDDDGGGATAAVGATNKSGGAYEVAATNIYRHQVSSGGGGVDNFGHTKILQQPFGYSHVGGGKGKGRFTAEQWKELERQAMIYKCMISSVPVPPHLLYPLSTNFPPAPLLPLYGKKGDPEPGRCKRTDGKKWRCSREVAPLQKYCDRHLHRGRPRSRKPVELNNNNNNNNNNINTAPNHKKTRTKSPPLPLPLFKPKTHLTISPPYLNATNRDLSLMMKQPWQDPIPTEAAAEIGMGSDYRSSFDEDYAPLDLFCYPNFPSQEMNLAAGFIDAKSSVSMSEGDLSPSLNLSMAMAVGDVLDEQMKNIQTTRAQDIDIDIDSMWLNPAGWEPFARGGGGPLAEALQSNPPSPYNSTTVSSPSGVLHRTLFSHSDGSVCNSPTATFTLIGN